MAISIVVQFTRTQLTELTDLCWRLTAEVTEATDMTSKIFVMHRVPEVAGESNYTDSFETVADAQDIERIPEDSPDLANEQPYYRVDTVELLFKDATTLEDIRSEMALLIQRTVEELKAIGGTATVTTETFS